MELKKIVAEVDSQIARLKQARALLTDGKAGGKRRGRPPGKSTKRAARKNHLSAAGRKRISDAMKRRWAARRKAAKK